MEMESWVGILYDSGGNEIIVPKDHAIVSGRDFYYFLKVENYDMGIAYQPERLNPEDTSNSVCDSLNNDGSR